MLWAIKQQNTSKHFLLSKIVNCSSWSHTIILSTANVAKGAIQTFMDAFFAMLATINRDFLLQL
jgi:hypothetical protein